MLPIDSYLRIVADSDLFGSLAILCLFAAIAGFSKKVRKSKLYFATLVACVLFMPIMHATGSYFLSQPNP